MEYRPFYFAREWIRSGHGATILAASFSHLRARQPEVQRDLQTTEEDGVRFRWLRTNRYAGNTSPRVLNMLTFVGKAMAHTGRLAREERPDVVVCSSTYPLDIYPGERIARKAGARLIFEVHDLWPLTPVLVGGYAPSHPYIRVLQRAEDRAYARADCVVSLLPDAAPYMVGQGVAPEKFVHIPNGIDAGMARMPHESLPTEIREAVDRVRSGGRFLVGYAGGINPSNCMEQVVAAARLLKGEPVTFFIAGHGSEFGRIETAVREAELDNFLLVGRIGKLQVQQFLAAMDALVVVFKKSPLYRYGVSPNKIFEYMLAARPVVQSLDASNDLVQAAGCGLSVPSDDVHGFAAAILHLRRLPEEERRRLGENGRVFVLREHDYRVLATRFLQAAGTATARPVLTAAVS